MEYIMVPLTTGLFFYAIYAVFELFVRRKERMAIIEKLADRLDGKGQDGKIPLLSYSSVPRINFLSLRIACLMIGIGLGLIVGFSLYLGVSADAERWGLSESDLRNARQVLFGASVLSLGGLGLVVSYLIERRTGNKENADK